MENVINVDNVKKPYLSPTAIIEQDDSPLTIDDRLKQKLNQCIDQTSLPNGKGLMNFINDYTGDKTECLAFVFRILNHAGYAFSGMLREVWRMIESNAGKKLNSAELANSFHTMCEIWNPNFGFKVSNNAISLTEQSAQTIADSTRFSYFNPSQPTACNAWIPLFKNQQKIDDILGQINSLRKSGRLSGQATQLISSFYEHQKLNDQDLDLLCLGTFKSDDANLYLHLNKITQDLENITTQLSQLISPEKQATSGNSLSSNVPNTLELANRIDEEIQPFDRNKASYLNSDNGQLRIKTHLSTETYVNHPLKQEQLPNTDPNVGLKVEKPDPKKEEIPALTIAEHKDEQSNKDFDNFLKMVQTELKKFEGHQLFKELNLKELTARPNKIEIVKQLSDLPGELSEDIINKVVINMIQHGEQLKPHKLENYLLVASINSTPSKNTLLQSIAEKALADHSRITNSIYKFEDSFFQEIIRSVDPRIQNWLTENRPELVRSQLLDKNFSN
jgi:hypothetical protein